MRKLLLSLALMLGFTTSAVADYTMIVPQKPGGGTSQWAQIVATEMEKYLDGEKIVLSTSVVQEIFLALTSSTMNCVLMTKLLWYPTAATV